MKQIASSTFDLPEPFGPEIAVKHASRSVSTVRLPCDLKPSRMISMSRIPACAIAGVSVGRGQERAVRAGSCRLKMDVRDADTQDAR